MLGLDPKSSVKGPFDMVDYLFEGVGVLASNLGEPTILPKTCPAWHYTSDLINGAAMDMKPAAGT